MSSEIQYTIVKAGERVDTLAYRLYGDTSKYKLLLQANPTLDLWQLQAGQRIEVPSA
jgi:phage tail protein X